MKKHAIPFAVGAVAVTASLGIVAIAVLAPRLGAFTGTVQSDSCTRSAEPGLVAPPPLGDVGCSITVGGKTVTIVHGNINVQTWGQVEGFTIDQDIVGKRVLVKAHPQGTGYAISGSDDFVKLLN